jgi:hypothetical protein
MSDAQEEHRNEAIAPRAIRSMIATKLWRTTRGRGLLMRAFVSEVYEDCRPDQRLSADSSGNGSYVAPLQVSPVASTSCVASTS